MLFQSDRPAALLHSSMGRNDRSARVLRPQFHECSTNNLIAGTAVQCKSSVVDSRNSELLIHDEDSDVEVIQNFVENGGRGVNRLDIDESCSAVHDSYGGFPYPRRSAAADPYASARSLLSYGLLQRGCFGREEFVKAGPDHPLARVSGIGEKPVGHHGNAPLLLCADHNKAAAFASSKDLVRRKQPNYSPPEQIELQPAYDFFAGCALAEKYFTAATPTNTPAIAKNSRVPKGSR